MAYSLSNDDGHSYLPDREGLTEGVDFYLSSGADDIPTNAIKAGNSPCGDVYVGAVRYLEHTIPCKIVSRNGCCYFSYGGQEISLPVLVYVVVKFGYSYEWIPQCNGHSSPDAIKFSTENEYFSFGRVSLEEESCVGKVLPNGGDCLAWKDGTELRMKYYDVLIVKPYPDIYGTYTGVSIYNSTGPGDIPANAIVADENPHYGKVYVGFAEFGIRKFHETTPASISSSDEKVFYTYDWGAYSTDKHMFLVVNPGYKYEWVPDGNGYTPTNGVRLGRKFNGENFYVGRIKVQNRSVVGKISTSQGCCDASVNGFFYCKKTYDVLVVTKQENGEPSNGTASLSTPLPGYQNLLNLSGYLPDRERLTCGTDFYLSKDPRDIPENAIKLGCSPCGDVYLGAIKYRGVTHPSKIVPEKKFCYFSYNDRELALPIFVYVVAKFGFSYEWLPSSEDDPHLPLDAVKFDAEPFAVGRVSINEERFVGKILPNDNICSISKDGTKLLMKNYDILVVKPYPDIYGCYNGVSIYHSNGIGDIPDNAIEAGSSPSTGKIYVGLVEFGDRNFHYARVGKWETTPAKIEENDLLAYYSYYGKEYSSKKLMFLIFKAGYTYVWEKGYRHGGVPPNAVRLGRKFNGENFYVGRIMVNGEYTVGKISTPHSCCYAPHRGKEYRPEVYDVLVVKKVNEPMPTSPHELPPTSLESASWNPYQQDDWWLGSNENDMVEDAEYDAEPPSPPLSLGEASRPPVVPENWTRHPFIVDEPHLIPQSFIEDQYKGLKDCLGRDEGVNIAEEGVDRFCIICHLNIPTRIVTPCGHDGLCRTCVVTLIREPRTDVEVQNLKNLSYAHFVLVWCIAFPFSIHFKKFCK